MKTRILAPTAENIDFCAGLLKSGEIVGVPTETVYGLAANAFDDDAVLKIFKAKGRPADNPLICHVSSLDMFHSLTSDDSAVLKALIKNFWPGPLTVIVKSSVKLSSFAVAGLLTVGIRFSSNRILNSLIDRCGFALAAPSANLSKKPSSTTAFHVYSDFCGKIGAILDGGDCEIGVESTIVKVEGDSCVLLRPGRVTLKMLEMVVGKVKFGRGVLESLGSDEVAESPGLKHRHYSPNAEIVVVKGSFQSFVEYVLDRLNDKVCCVVFDGEQVGFEGDFVLTYGKTVVDQAKNLFSVLRKIDELGFEKAYFRCPSVEGVGLAVYNRLIRAAEFRIVEL